MAWMKAAGLPAEAPHLRLLAAHSEALIRVLCRHPQDAEVLDPPIDLDALKPSALRAELDSLAGEAPDEARFKWALRRLKARAFLRLTGAELWAGLEVAESCRALTTLAEVCLQATVGFAHAQARSPRPLDEAGAPIPFVVLGMGKLGGWELNYSSDIDLIYFYGADEAQGGGDAHRYFRQISQKITALISDITEEGFVFRVDLRLRPEGRSGPLCNALASAERYYEAWGRLWERIAFLRARPVAGDLALGVRLLARLNPWIYQRNLDAGLIDRFAQLTAQAIRGEAGVDLKLSPGGIRSVEFLVHLYQLLHGGRQPDLRTPSTQEGLARLVARGHLEASEAAGLLARYRRLRVLEHRVQMEHERQTHRLPEGEALEALARRLGWADAPDAEALRRRVWEMTRANAEALDARLGAPVEEPPQRRLARALLDAHRDDEAALTALADHGLRDPRQALHLIKLGARSPNSPLSPQAPHAALGLDLLEGALRAPHPERALAHLSMMTTRLARRPQYFEGLASTPSLRRLLMHTFSTSDFLSEALLHDPQLIDDLYDPFTDLEALSTRLAALAAVEDEEAQLEGLSRLKAREALRVGLRHLARQIDGREVEAHLSALAEGILRLLLQRAQARACPAPLTGLSCCALAFGKLGGRELSYGSDLDVIFLYEDPPEGHEADALEHFTRVARRVISRLGLPTRWGPLYQVDTRLRPGGRQGTLVTSLRRFKRYHAEEAAIWERMALVRARPVGGSPALQRAAAEAIEALLYARPAPPNLTAEMRHLRARMERELAHEGGGRYNPKLGHGGLVDLEFIAQRRQLLQGEPRTQHTLCALMGLDHPQAAALAHAWRALKEIEHALRLEHGHPQAELRDDPAALDGLARRLYGIDAGPQAGQRLLRDYLERARFVRAQFEAEFSENNQPPLS